LKWKKQANKELEERKSMDYLWRRWTTTKCEEKSNDSISSNEKGQERTIEICTRRRDGASDVEDGTP